MHIKVEKHQSGVTILPGFYLEKVALCRMPCLAERTCREWDRYTHTKTLLQPP